MWYARGVSTSLFGVLLGHYQRDSRITDEDRLRAAHVERAVEPGGDVMLISCSTGQGKKGGRNLANMVARLFPASDVWAPAVDTNIRPSRLSEENVFDCLAGEAVSTRSVD